MNLESLKQRISTATPFKWRGETIHLRKIGAMDGAKMVAYVEERKAQPTDAAKDRADTIDFHVTAISKSLADESGSLQVDSDEGRETLRQLPFDELVELGDLVLDHSGFALSDEKKSTSGTTTNLLSDCVLNSECRIPITYSAS